MKNGLITESSGIRHNPNKGVVLQNLAVEIQFERALEAILMRVFHGQDHNHETSANTKEGSGPVSVAVAYSGGLDSTVLLHLLWRYSKRNDISMFAFHVHHGLNRQADAWRDHCEEVCTALGIRFESRRVQVERHGKNGIEADARSKRYAALGDMCRKNGVILLLTAHHRDDQVETILFHLMRGTGMSGLSGMDSVICAPELLKDSAICLGRPLLSLSRENLSQWAGQNNLSHVEDDSNTDTDYTRNAIRHRMVPVMSDIFPGFQKRLTRMAEHVRLAHELLDRLGKEDLQACMISGNRLDLARTESFDIARMDNLLRCWFGENGVRIPSAAWFAQAKKQMLGARPDAQISLQTDGHVIRKYRTVLSVERNMEKRTVPSGMFHFRWDGESSVCLKSWHGVLAFEESETGFDSDWLKKHALRIGPYRGNAELKLLHRPTKKLKILCQEAGIPLWERLFLPLVFVGNELVYVGKLGPSAKFVRKGKKCIRFVWKPLS